MKKNLWITVLIVLVVVILVGAGSFLFIKNNKKDEKSPNWLKEKMEEGYLTEFYKPEQVKTDLTDVKWKRGDQVDIYFLGTGNEAQSKVPYLKNVWLATDIQSNNSIGILVPKDYQKNVKCSIYLAKKGEIEIKKSSNQKGDFEINEDIKKYIDSDCLQIDE